MNRIVCTPPGDTGLFFFVFGMGSGVGWRVESGGWRVEGVVGSYVCYSRLTDVVDICHGCVPLAE